jgi:hypothetical protein
MDCIYFGVVGKELQHCDFELTFKEKLRRQFLLSVDCLCCKLKMPYPHEQRSAYEKWMNDFKAGLEPKESTTEYRRSQDFICTTCGSTVDHEDGPCFEDAVYGDGDFDSNHKCSCCGMWMHPCGTGSMGE